MSNVSDVHETPATFMLEGETYTLRYDFNAWAEMEEEYGSMSAVMNALESAQELAGKPVTTIRYFLWVGMHQDIPELTLNDVGRMITPANMGELLKTIGQAVEASTSSGGETGE